MCECEDRDQKKSIAAMALAASGKKVKKGKNRIGGNEDKISPSSNFPAESPEQ